MCIRDSKWNYAEFAERRAKKQAEDQKVQFDVEQNMMNASQLFEAKETDKAIQIVDDLIKKYDSHAISAQLKTARTQMLMVAGGERGAKAMRDYGEANKNDPFLLNQMAWSIVNLKQSGQAVDAQMLVAAEKIAKLAADSKPDSGAILYTHANLIYLNGNLDKAIEVQQQAVANSGEMLGQFQPFLNRLLLEKANQN